MATQTQQQREERRRRTAALAAGTGVAVVAGTAAARPEMPSPAARASAAKRILEALIAFFAAFRERVRGQVRAQLVQQAPGVEASVIDDVLAEEDRRQVEFERKAQARVARAVTIALAIPDPQLRDEALKQIMLREQRFAQQRSEAMLARASAAIERVSLKQVSPTGAFWRLDPTVREHTAGCLVMGGKFWPWQVLDRVHPPRHAACPCRLVGYADAVGSGELIPSQVMDVRRAVQLAAGVVMEGVIELPPLDALELVEDAERAAREEYRDALVEAGVADAAQLDAVFEAFDRDQPRYPKGHPRAGQWRPKLATAGSPQQRAAFTRSIAKLRQQSELPVSATVQQGDEPPRTVRRRHTTAELQAIGAKVAELAEKHSQAQVYRDRISALNEERSALWEKPWDRVVERFGSDSAGYEWEEQRAKAEGREPRDDFIDEFFTDGERARLTAIEAEVGRLIPQMDRARQDALIGVLAQTRPMGGRIKAGKVQRIEHRSAQDIHSGQGEDVWAHEADAGERAAMDAALRDVQRMVPSAWIESSNAGDGIDFELSERRAFHRLREDRTREKQETQLDRILADGGPAEFVGYSGVWPVVREKTGERRMMWLDWGGGMHTMDEGDRAGADITANLKPAARVPWRSPSTIRTNPEERDVLLHELAHRFEAVHGEKRQTGLRPLEEAMQTFLRERTEGEEAVRLMDLHPGSGYEDHERTRPDKFVDAYIGKDYGGRASEVLTMGMQLAFFPTYSRSFDGKFGGRDDMPMRDFILGVVAAL